MAKVFITGATGFLGFHVVSRFQRQGYQVTAWSRSKATAERLEKATGATVHVGQFNDHKALVDASKGSIAIIHLVGAISETGAPSFEETHIASTQAIIAAARSNGISRIIYISALGARPHARSRYHQTKFAAEELLRQSGLDYTILRPSFIFGDGNHTLRLFQTLTSFPFNLLQLYTLPCFGFGKNLLQPIHVNDVAEAIYRSLINPAAVGATLDIVGPQRVSFSEFLLRICHDLGKRAEFDPYGIKTIARHLHWGVTFWLAIFILLSLIQNLLALPIVILLIAIEALLLKQLFRPHTILIFPIPLWLVIPHFYVLDYLLKKFPVFKAPIGADTLLMLEEDNIGDIGPLQHLLGLSPAPFISDKTAATDTSQPHPLHRPLKKLYA
jgi:NADH dehydrogenase